MREIARRLAPCPCIHEHSALLGGCGSCGSRPHRQIACEPLASSQTACSHSNNCQVIWLFNQSGPGLEKVRGYSMYRVHWYRSDLQGLGRGPPILTKSSSLIYRSHPSGVVCRSLAASHRQEKIRGKSIHQLMSCPGECSDDRIQLLDS